MFFEQFVCFNDQHRSSSLKPYPSFNPDQGISHMGIPTDRPGGTDLFYFTNGSDPGNFLPVYSYDLSLPEFQLK